MAVPETAELEAQGRRLAALVVPVDQETLAGFKGWLARTERQGRLEPLIATLAEGGPGRLADLLEGLSVDLAPDAPWRVEELAPLCYWEAVDRRLEGDDVVSLLTALEELLGAGAARWQPSTPGGRLLEALALVLFPPAGLDVAAAFGYAAIFGENFPSFSRPLGDVAERAAAWIAQILDVGSTRSTQRLILARLAVRCPHPLARIQVRAWAEDPPPADPREDLLWVRALTVLARARV